MEVEARDGGGHDPAVAIEHRMMNEGDEQMRHVFYSLRRCPGVSSEFCLARKQMGTPLSSALARLRFAPCADTAVVAAE